MSSFVVSEGEVGKKISVKVTGDVGSEATSAETAAVEAAADADLEITAKQTGASEFTITSNKPVASTDKITVTRGSSE